MTLQAILSGKEYEAGDVELLLRAVTDGQVQVDNVVAPLIVSSRTVSQQAIEAEQERYATLVDQAIVSAAPTIIPINTLGVVMPGAPGHWAALFIIPNGNQPIIYVIDPNGTGSFTHHVSSLLAKSQDIKPVVVYNQGRQEPLPGSGAAACGPLLVEDIRRLYQFWLRKQSELGQCTEASWQFTESEPWRFVADDEVMVKTKRGQQPRNLGVNVASENLRRLREGQAELYRKQEQLERSLVTRAQPTTSADDELEGIKPRGYRTAVDELSLKEDIRQGARTQPPAVSGVNVEPPRMASVPVGERASQRWSGRQPASPIVLPEVTWQWVLPPQKQQEPSVSASTNNPVKLNLDMVVSAQRGQSRSARPRTPPSPRLRPVSPLSPLVPAQVSQQQRTCIFLPDSNDGKDLPVDLQRQYSPIKNFNAEQAVLLIGLLDQLLKLPTHTPPIYISKVAVDNAEPKNIHVWFDGNSQSVAVPLTDYQEFLQQAPQLKPNTRINYWNDIRVVAAATLEQMNNSEDLFIPLRALQGINSSLDQAINNTHSAIRGSDQVRSDFTQQVIAFATDLESVEKDLQVQLDVTQDAQFQPIRALITQISEQEFDNVVRENEVRLRRDIIGNFSDFWQQDGQKLPELQRSKAQMNPIAECLDLYQQIIDKESAETLTIFNKNEALIAHYAAARQKLKTLFEEHAKGYVQYYRPLFDLLDQLLPSDEVSRFSRTSGYLNSPVYKEIKALVVQMVQGKISYNQLITALSAISTKNATDRIGKKLNGFILHLQDFLASLPASQQLVSKNWMERDLIIQQYAQDTFTKATEARNALSVYKTQTLAELAAMQNTASSIREILNDNCKNPRQALKQASDSLYNYFESPTQSHAASFARVQTAVNAISSVPIDVTDPYAQQFRKLSASAQPIRQVLQTAERKIGETQGLVNVARAMRIEQVDVLKQLQKETALFRPEDIDSGIEALKKEIDDLAGVASASGKITQLRGTINLLERYQSSLISMDQLPQAQARIAQLLFEIASRALNDFKLKNYSAIADFEAQQRQILDQIKIVSEQIQVSAEKRFVVDENLTKALEKQNATIKYLQAKFQKIEDAPIFAEYNKLKADYLIAQSNVKNYSAYANAVDARQKLVTAAKSSLSASHYDTFLFEENLFDLYEKLLKIERNTNEALPKDFNKLMQNFWQWIEAYRHDNETDISKDLAESQAEIAETKRLIVEFADEFFIPENGAQQRIKDLCREFNSNQLPVSTNAAYETLNQLLTSSKPELCIQQVKDWNIVTPDDIKARFGDKYIDAAGLLISYWQGSQANIEVAEYALSLLNKFQALAQTDSALTKLNETIELIKNLADFKDALNNYLFNVDESFDSIRVLYGTITNAQANIISYCTKLLQDYPELISQQNPRLIALNDWIKQTFPAELQQRYFSEFNTQLSSVVNNKLADLHTQAVKMIDDARFTATISEFDFSRLQTALNDLTNTGKNPLIAHYLTGPDNERNLRAVCSNFNRIIERTINSWPQNELVQAQNKLQVYLQLLENPVMLNGQRIFSIEYLYYFNVLGTSGDGLLTQLAALYDQPIKYGESYHPSQKLFEKLLSFSWPIPAGSESDFEEKINAAMQRLITSYLSRITKTALNGDQDAQAVWLQSLRSSVIKDQLLDLTLRAEHIDEMGWSWLINQTTVIDYALALPMPNINLLEAIMRLKSADDNLIRRVYKQMQAYVESAGDNKLFAQKAYVELLLKYPLPRKDLQQKINWLLQINTLPLATLNLDSAQIQSINAQKSSYLRELIAQACVTLDLGAQQLWLNVLEKPGSILDQQEILQLTCQMIDDSNRPLPSGLLDSLAAYVLADATLAWHPGVIEMIYQFGSPELIQQAHLKTLAYFNQLAADRNINDLQKALDRYAEIWQKFPDKIPTNVQAPANYKETAPNIWFEQYLRLKRDPAEAKQKIADQMIGQVFLTEGYKQQMGDVAARESNAAAATELLTDLCRDDGVWLSGIALKQKLEQLNGMSGQQQSSLSRLLSDYLANLPAENRQALRENLIAAFLPRFNSMVDAYFKQAPAAIFAKENFEVLAAIYQALSPESTLSVVKDFIDSCEGVVKKFNPAASELEQMQWLKNLACVRLFTGNISNVVPATALSYLMHEAFAENQIAMLPLLEVSTQKPVSAWLWQEPLLNRFVNRLQICLENIPTNDRHAKLIAEMLQKIKSSGSSWESWRALGRNLRDFDRYSEIKFGAYEQELKPLLSFLLERGLDTVSEYKNFQQYYNPAVKVKQQDYLQQEKLAYLKFLLDNLNKGESYRNQAALELKNLLQQPDSQALLALMGDGYREKIQQILTSNEVISEVQQAANLALVNLFDELNPYLFITDKIDPIRISVIEKQVSTALQNFAADYQSADSVHKNIFLAQFSAQLERLNIFLQQALRGKALAYCNLKYAFTALGEIYKVVKKDLDKSLVERIKNVAEKAAEYYVIEANPYSASFLGSREASPRNFSAESRLNNICMLAASRSFVHCFGSEIQNKLCDKNSAAITSAYIAHGALPKAEHAAPFSYKMVEALLLGVPITADMDLSGLAFEGKIKRTPQFHQNCARRLLDESLADRLKNRRAGLDQYHQFPKLINWFREFLIKKLSQELNLAEAAIVKMDLPELAIKISSVTSDDRRQLNIWNNALAIVKECLENLRANSGFSADLTTALQSIWQRVFDQPFPPVVNFAVMTAAPADIIATINFAEQEVEVLNLYIESHVARPLPTPERPEPEKSRSFANEKQDYICYLISQGEFAMANVELNRLHLALEAKPELNWRLNFDAISAALAHYYLTLPPDADQLPNELTTMLQLVVSFEPTMIEVPAGQNLSDLIATLEDMGFVKVIKNDADVSTKLFQQIMRLLNLSSQQLSPVEFKEQAAAYINDIQMLCGQVEVFYLTDAQKRLLEAKAQQLAVDDSLRAILIQLLASSTLENLTPQHIASAMDSTENNLTELSQQLHSFVEMDFKNKVDHSGYPTQLAEILSAVLTKATGLQTLPAWVDASWSTDVMNKFMQSYRGFADENDAADSLYLQQIYLSILMQAKGFKQTGMVNIVSALLPVLLDTSWKANLARELTVEVERRAALGAVDALTKLLEQYDLSDFSTFSDWIKIHFSVAEQLVKEIDEREPGLTVQITQAIFLRVKLKQLLNSTIDQPVRALLSLQDLLTQQIEELNHFDAGKTEHGQLLASLKSFLNILNFPFRAALLPQVSPAKILQTMPGTAEQPTIADQFAEYWQANHLRLAEMLAQQFTKDREQKLPINWQGSHSYYLLAQYLQVSRFHPWLMSASEKGVLHECFVVLLSQAEIRNQVLQLMDKSESPQAFANNRVILQTLSSWMQNVIHPEIRVASETMMRQTDLIMNFIYDDYQKRTKDFDSRAVLNRSYRIAFEAIAADQDINLAAVIDDTKRLYAMFNETERNYLMAAFMLIVQHSSVDVALITSGLPSPLLNICLEKMLMDWLAKPEEMQKHFQRDLPQIARACESCADENSQAAYQAFFQTIFAQISNQEIAEQMFAIRASGPVQQIYLAELVNRAVVGATLLSQEQANQFIALPDPRLQLFGLYNLIDATPAEFSKLQTQMNSDQPLDVKQIAQSLLMPRLESLLVQKLKMATEAVYKEFLNLNLPVLRMYLKLMNQFEVAPIDANHLDDMLSQFLSNCVTALGRVTSRENYELLISQIINQLKEFLQRQPLPKVSAVMVEAGRLLGITDDVAAVDSREHVTLTM